MSVGTGLTSTISGNTLTLNLDPTAKLTLAGTVSDTMLSAANAGLGYGVYGSSAFNHGVYGYSDRLSGVFGSTHGAGTSRTFANPIVVYLNAGVWGDAGKSGGDQVGMVATADDTSAAVFANSSANLPTLDLNNLGGGAKSSERRASAPLLFARGQGGSCRITTAGDVSCTGEIKTLARTQAGSRTVETYAVHSAENWVEDFGTGKLAGGVAAIPLDATFAETANTGMEYHVFLTPRGECGGLYVTGQTATSFEVRELGHGTSSVAFDYRIVAKRRGTEGDRLVDVTERMKAEEAANGPHVAKP